MKREIGFFNKDSYNFLEKKDSSTTTSKLKLETYTFPADKKEEFFKYIEDNNYTLPEGGKEIIQEYFTKNFSIVFNYFYIEKPALSDAVIQLDEEREKNTGMLPEKEIFQDMIQEEERRKELGIEKETSTLLPEKICLNVIYKINPISPIKYFSHKNCSIYTQEGRSQSIFTLMMLLKL